MKLLLISLLGLSLLSCQSLPIKRDYESALGYVANQSYVKAKRQFSKLCKSNHYASCLVLGHQIPPHHSLSILQGANDGRNTLINILKQKDEHYIYILWKDLNPTFLTPSNRKTWPNSTWETVNLKLMNLTPGDYRLDILTDDYQLVDFRYIDNKTKEQKIAIASCLDDSYDSLQKQQWTALLKKSPTSLFLIGDNIYIKPARKFYRKLTPDLIWDRYVETRNNLLLYKHPKLIPTYATWDDHDYGPDDGGKNFSYKKQSKEIFLSFFPQTAFSSIKSNGPGLSSHIEIQGVPFYFLDNRSFRSEKKQTGYQSHFGKEQIKWLVSSLKKNAKPSFIISGGQFFGSHHPFESFSRNHGTAFDKFIEKIKTINLPVAFISGDRHLVEFQKIPKKFLGYTTYELTSSGLHARYYPGALKKAPSPYGVFGKDGESNFMILSDFKVNKKTLNFKVHAFGDKGRHLYSQSLLIKE